jgi:hypothetical protein
MKVVEKLMILKENRMKLSEMLEMDEMNEMI